VAQAPPAGSFVRIHSGVVLTLVGAELPAVPDVVGQRQQAAEDHLRLDGFAMTVDSTQRVLWPLVVQVRLQRPTVGARLSQDLPVHVDLTTPMVPPIPASIAAVVLVGAVVATRTPIWPRPKPKPDPRWRPITDLSFDVRAGAPSSPVLHAATPKNLAKVTVSFDVITTAGFWQVEPDHSSLVER
jgi:hypothetical protein